MSYKAIYSAAVVEGRIVHGEVSVVGFSQFEQVRITNRNGDEIIIDKDSLSTLIAALAQAQVAIKNNVAL